jgi:hypothetical protein
MIKYLEKFAPLVLLAGCALLYQCGTLTIAGATSDTTNGRVIGTLVRQNGEPADSSIVQLIPCMYNPVTDNPIPHTQICTTDAQGKYHLSAPDSGVFNIQAVSSIDHTRLLARNIRTEKDSVFVPVDTLRMPGLIRVKLPSGLDENNGYFYLPGTTIYSWLYDNNGYVMLKAVPAAAGGENLSVYYAVWGSAAKPQTIADSVLVTPGGITNIEYVGWAFSKKLILNTTVSGANVAGNVTNFPILVRLTNTNFNFTQAKSGGEDVRFTKSDGTPLSYEIERWDAAQGSAEIWVKADTVFGNDNKHFLTMFWGNPGAASESNGAAVFAAANGFKAVWHLGRDCMDVTGNGYNGTNYGTVDTEGVIGISKKFDGTDSIKINGLLGTPSNITLSGWAQLDTTSERGGEIFSIGDYVLIRMDNIPGNSGVQASFHLPSTGPDTAYYDLSSGRFLAKTGWHHVAFTLDNVRHVQILYIDGVQAAVGNSADSIGYSGLGTNSYIGKNGSPKDLFNFIGRIDEVRVCGLPRSGDWIKLCYMNQKESDVLLQFH